MSTVIDAEGLGPTAASPSEKTDTSNYLTAGYTLRSWLLTVDHKRIAMLYLFSVTFFFVIGGILALLIRLELMTPKGDLVSSDVYNRLFTQHGIIMIFLFLIPAIPGVFGNFLIPLMVGAKDLAFPRINLASWYMYMIGAGLAVYAMASGGVDTGWTFYTPYATRFANSSVVAAGLGAFIVGFSSVFTGLNFAVTIHKMRAPGLTWFRLPLFVWAHYATSLIMLLGTPVVAITILLVAIERLWGVGIFDPSLGGDPILFQHLFWFYSHPAVYIMILPAMGVMSEIFSTFSRKPVFGYPFIAMSSLAIAIIGFFVWGHHMFVSGQSEFAGLVFSALTFLVAIPSAVKVFNWTATLYKGSISLATPMIYGIGFIGLFAIGGLTGLFLGALGMDYHVHDTYFVVAHFHYVMVGATIMGFLGALHYWWPKMTGKLYPEGWGQLAAIVIFIGFNLTFFPQFILGYLGMPRQYHEYVPEFQILHVMSSAGAMVLGLGYLLPFSYLTYSWFYGPKAPANPWGATGLEWQTSSPPPTHNFDKTPVVDFDPYDYRSVVEGTTRVERR